MAGITVRWSMEATHTMRHQPLVYMRRPMLGGDVSRIGLGGGERRMGMQSQCPALISEQDRELGGPSPCPAETSVWDRDT